MDRRRWHFMTRAERAQAQARAASATEQARQTRLLLETPADAATISRGLTAPQRNAMDIAVKRGVCVVAHPQVETSLLLKGLIAPDRTLTPLGQMVVANRRVVTSDR